METTLNSDWNDIMARVEEIYGLEWEEVDIPTYARETARMEADERMAEELKHQ
jgi:hypothetical protein